MISKNASSVLDTVIFGDDTNLYVFSILTWRIAALYIQYSLVKAKLQTRD